MQTLAIYIYNRINLLRWTIILIVSILSFVVWIISYKTGVSTAYNDAMAHINLARMVFDNLQPGFSQLGGVWLPLNQILYLPLVWNNWAWHSGFAGSIVSMISYILSVYLIFESVYFLLKNRLAGLVSALLFAVNVNILYLQTTPLTEPLFLLIFIASFYFFTRWILEKKTTHLIIVALLGFFLVLSRYDGWFVVIVESGLVVLYEFIYYRKKYLRLLGTLFVFAMPSLYGIFLWLLWNKLIFGSFLFFALGPYSAHAQQAVLSDKSGGLISKGNLWMSFLAYYLTIKENIGLILIILAIVGTIYFIKQKSSITVFQKLLILVFLLSPVIFNILSLFFGFSIVNVPELHWNPSFNVSGSWFNVRYGIFALPIIAFLIGFVAQKTKVLAGICTVIILIQSIYFLATVNNIVTMTDGLQGSSKFQNPDISKYLKSHIVPDEKVLLSISYFSPVVFQSDIDMKQVIHEGSSIYWAKALNYPYTGEKWIVMSNGSTGDPVYNILVNKQKKSFLSMYKLAYSGVHADVYRTRSKQELFIRRDGIKLMEGSSSYIMTGVNSYDLAYKDEKEIRENFLNFKKLKINTIRIWAFGDGTSDGFQPKAGITNENRLKRMDLVLSIARENNIRVIPVLVNNWDDFGGKNAYVKWIGQNSNDLFYTDKNAKNLFKNYMNKMISRKNTYSGDYYYEDPTILAWDIMNEPRIDDQNRTDILKNWANEMGDYIKKNDPNHLVSIGTEQASDICSANSIDLCSVHLYIENSNDVKYQSLNDITGFFESQKKASQSLKKPIYIGELGLSKASMPFDQQPLSVFYKMVKDIKQEKYNGYLVWNWSLKGDNSYDFSPKGTDNTYTLSNLQNVIQN